MWGKGKRLWFQRVLLSLIALCCLLPMVYLLWSSLAGRGGVSQYERVLLDSREFYTWLWNSAGYTALILLLHIPISILADPIQKQCVPDWPRCRQVQPAVEGASLTSHQSLR